MYLSIIHVISLLLGFYGLLVSFSSLFIALVALLFILGSLLAALLFVGRGFTQSLRGLAPLISTKLKYQTNKVTACVIWCGGFVLSSANLLISFCEKQWFF
jgi:hypothetical protein